MLGEKAQLSACKDIVTIIYKLMNALDVHPENTKDSANAETMYSQHQLVVALQELGMVHFPQKFPLLHILFLQVHFSCVWAQLREP